MPAHKTGTVVQKITGQSLRKQTHAAMTCVQNRKIKPF